MDQTLPIIDMASLRSKTDAAQRANAAEAIRRAAEVYGFFYVVGHGVRAETLQSLERESHAFFALDLEDKLRIRMSRGGRAWRGYFPVGGELTSGRPDLKEGLYFGTELPAHHPRVVAGLPMHGPNLWPKSPAGLRPAVEAFMAEAQTAAAAVLEGVSESLGLGADYFDRTYMGEPTVLFRIFNYPAEAPDGPDWRGSWGVGEHTDYGLLTLLAQDRLGGLQVKAGDGWIDAPPIEGALVCNIGDMLERLTLGRFRSVPHRVLNRSGQDRLSFPFFFDPDFLAPMRAPPGLDARPPRDREARWDQASVHDFDGTYGEYLLGKVAKVFPDLGESLQPPRA